jgi:DNA-binding IclR family transcriptional regulator
MAYQGSSRTIRAVDISCRILKTLKRHGSLGVTAIATELDHSKSTVHSHLATLVENDLLVKDGDQYKLSLLHLDMAEQVKAQVGNYDIVRSEVDTLAERTQEVARFAVAEQGRIVCLYKRTSGNGMKTPPSVGKTQPLHSSAIGKAILSTFPDGRVGEIVDDRDLERKTENTITSRERLFQELQQIRERGYAVDREENVEGIRCVAAPVYYRSIRGGVSVTAPASRLQGARLEEELPDQVCRTANLIEVNSRFQS